MAVAASEEMSAAEITKMASADASHLNPRRTAFLPRTPERGGVQIDAPDVEVNLDGVRVRQALHNLIDNAIRHSNAADVSVRGSVQDGVVRIAVEDNGPGFPDGFAASAFEPFRQGSTVGGSSEQRPGAGLGLAIVRAIAQSHGGDAVAENRAEGGGRVVVTFRQ
ncbi:MAG: hypothetical protein NVSMB57_07740 [Actinomycetota bacterium]